MNPNKNILVLENDIARFLKIRQLFSKLDIADHHIIRKGVDDNFEIDRLPDQVFVSLTDVSNPYNFISNLIIRLGETPIVILVNHADLNITSQLLDMGVWDIITWKELDEVKLFRTLKTAHSANKSSIRSKSFAESPSFRQDISAFNFPGNEVLWEYEIETEKVFRPNNSNQISEDDQTRDSHFLNIWKNNIHPEDFQATVNRLQHVIHGSDLEWSATYRFKNKDGKYTYVLDKATIIRNDHGEAYKAIGSMKELPKQSERDQQLNLLESVVKNSNDAILITEASPIDKPGPRIIYANQAFYDNTEYLPHEILGKSPRILQGPKTSRKELDKVRMAMENQTSCQVEVINYMKSGKEFWVEFSIAPVFNGGTTHFISIQRDITERKIEELKQEFLQKINQEITRAPDLEQRYQVILKNLIAISDFDLAEGWLTNIDNSRIRRVAHYTKRDDLKGFFNDRTSFVEALKDEGMPGKMWMQMNTLHWSDLHDNPDFIRKLDAEDYGIQSALAIPLISHEQLVGGIILFSKKNLNISEGFTKILNELNTHLGPEFLRMKNERELNTFFELSPGILSVIDREGFFKKVNPSFSALLGYKNGSIEKLKLKDLIDKNDLQSFEEHFEKQVEKGGDHSIECKCRTKEGKPIYLSWKLTYSAYDNLIYAVAKDISEKKTLEHLLQDTNELAKVGSWELDLEKGTLFWSKVVKSIHEVNDDFQPQLETALLFYKEGESREKIDQRVNQSISGKLDQWREEVKLITARGNEKWVHVECKTEYENGQCIRLYGSIQDIHTYKTTEKSLAETNYRYELATQANQFGIWDYNVRDKAFIFDDIVYDLFGLARGNFEGSYEELLKSLHPHDVKLFNAKFKKAIQMDDHLHITYRVIHPDQSLHYLKTHANIIRNEEGKAQRSIGIVYDITDDIQQQEELKKTYREKESILESITDGFFTVNSDWIVTYWNAAAEEITGMPKEHIVGKELWDVYADKINTPFYKEGQLAMSLQEIRRFQEYTPQLDKWVDVIVYPKKDGFSAHFKDITHQKKQELQIIEMKNLQQHVINSTNDIIWAIDTDYRLILGNDAYFKQMRLVSGEEYKIGEKIVTTVEGKSNLSDAQKKEWTKAYNKAFNDEQIVHNFKLEVKDGPNRHFQVDIHPIKQMDKDGNKLVKGLACFSRELTKELNYIEAIEKQNESLKDIAWMQSHIVRTPVSRIMALANMILEEKNNSKIYGELLPHLLSSTEELDEIIHNIVDKTKGLEFNIEVEE